MRGLWLGLNLAPVAPGEPWAKQTTI
eukprot:COSAG03_NODE_8870_length_764_cov_0.987970_2_plen_25_part_01